MKGSRSVTASESWQADSPYILPLTPPYLSHSPHHPTSTVHTPTLLFILPSPTNPPHHWYCHHSCLTTPLHHSHPLFSIPPTHHNSTSITHTHYSNQPLHFHCHDHSTTHMWPHHSHSPLLYPTTHPHHYSTPAAYTHHNSTQSPLTLTTTPPHRSHSPPPLLTQPLRLHPWHLLLYPDQKF